MATLSNNSLKSTNSKNTETTLLYKTYALILSVTCFMTVTATKTALFVPRVTEGVGEMITVVI